MARVIVDVMLKPEILDPQGRAVSGALTRLGITGVNDVRQGKRFEITVDGNVADVDESAMRSIAPITVHAPAAVQSAMAVPPDCGLG